MKWSSFRYLSKQGWRNMFANRMMTIASLGVLISCLVITGVAVLLSANVNSFIVCMQSNNEVEVFLNDIDAETTKTIETSLKGLDNIAQCDYISKTQAVQDQMAEMEDQAYMEGYLKEGAVNPLPASMRLSLTDISRLNETVQAVKEICGENTYLIQVPAELADILVTLQRVVTYAGWGLVGVLGLVSIVVISNTIRLTVFARRKEINIMKYVGATNAFIRLPFFVEGMTVGALAGLLSTGIVCGAYYFVLDFAQTNTSTLFEQYIQAMLPLDMVWPWMLGGFVAFGMLIGSVGCAASIRKHLKV